MVQPNKHKIPRVAKLDDEANELPLASDLLVASLWRRLLAVLLDLGIIATLTFYGTNPALHMIISDVEFYGYMRILAFASFATWGLYVSLCNVSAMRATIGQGIMRIYVCDVFGARINMLKAIGRFVVFSAPILLLIAGGLEEIMSVFPALFFADPDPAMKEVSEYFYVLVLVVALAQFMLIWPLLAGNYSRVLWDDLFHTRVLLKKMRSL